MLLAYGHNINDSLCSEMIMKLIDVIAFFCVSSTVLVKRNKKYVLIISMVDYRNYSIFTVMTRDREENQRRGQMCLRLATVLFI